MEDGNLTLMESKILNAIDDGTLTKEKLEKGVCTLIEIELEQNERPANMEMISDCESLLEKMHQMRYTSHSQESEKAVRLRLDKRMKRWATMQHTLRVVAVVVVIFTIGILNDQVRNKRSLEGKSTTDEQQYIETGNREITGAFMQSSQADVQNSILSSNEINEIIDVLGFQPEVPTWLPKGWKPDRYYVSNSRYAASVKLQYSKQNTDYLVKYSETLYGDIDSANVAFEQSEKGSEYSVNGKNIYISENVDVPIAIWIVEKKCYSLSGPLTKQEILEIIDSLQEVNVQ